MEKAVKKDYYEQEAWKSKKLVAGTDEVGRGCLAGPVVTAAVILRSQTRMRLLKDSKVLTPEERTKAFSWIIANSWYSYTIYNHRIIDRYNIYRATQKAMHKSFVQLMAQAPQAPVYLISDAMPLTLKDKTIQVVSMTKAEQKSRTVAAASIVAKVIRDTIMQRYNSSFPLYSYHQHKGYATAAHKQALLVQGASVIHRTSFIKSFENNTLVQTSLFNTQSKQDQL